MRHEPGSVTPLAADVDVTLEPVTPFGAEVAVALELVTPFGSVIALMPGVDAEPQPAALKAKTATVTTTRSRQSLCDLRQFFIRLADLFAVTVLLPKLPIGRL
jgi:hypothetical protein